MISCARVVDIEELVLDAHALDPEDARELRELRAHARECEACRAELALVTAERALFAARARPGVMPEPDASIVLAAKERIGAERVARARRVPRLAAGVVRLFRRGHMTAACAAAVFAFVGFSRVGTGSVVILPADAAPQVDDGAGAGGELFSDGRLASWSWATSETTLACNVHANEMVATASTDPLVCGSRGDHACDRASCVEAADVTCSPLRQ